MKKIVRSLLLICLVALLCIPGKVLFAADSDDRIESAAKASYVFKRYLKDENIHIQSKDGAVLLTGTVSEEYQKSLANDMVANILGVKSVNNKLGLTSETPAVYSDAWILTKVKSTLSFHRNVDSIGAEVWVGDGTVTLRGKASSIAQKDLATEYALDVEGVKNVINEITVAPAAKNPDAIMPDQSEVAKKIDTAIEFMDDASITALAKTTLLYHRSTHALKIMVSTNNGMVRLEGSVKNAAEKELAAKLVSDVHGVKGVVDNMVIR
jgi:osmotically-inducible protein OsmY